MPEPVWSRGSALRGRDWLVIAGSDDAGTRAAAAAFAGRMPHAGSADGATLTELTMDIEEYLDGEGISVQSVNVSTIHSERQRRRNLLLGRRCSPSVGGRCPRRARPL